MSGTNPTSKPEALAGGSSITFVLNHEVVRTDAPPGTATVDHLRRTRRLTGTKIGCREGDCGACTVLLGELEGDVVTYRAVNSCLLPLAQVAGRHVVTVEGLEQERPGPLQEAIVHEGASQCGFCTPGIVMSATGAMLRPGASPESLVEAVQGNICRCTGYASIRRALDRAADVLPEGDGDRLAALVERGVVPAYFPEVPAMLAKLSTRRPETGDGLVIAGGTDLMVQRPDRVLRGPISFFERAPGDPIQEQDDEILLDAATTFSELERSPIFRRLVPDISDHLRLVASPQIRELATLGGNVANASPIGDVSGMLLALGATAVLAKADSLRRLPLEDLFLDYKTLALEPGEIIRSFAVPSRAPDRFSFEKVSRRKRLDIASVTMSMALRTDGGAIVSGRISAGGVAPFPLFLEGASGLLAGKAISWETALEVAATAAAEARPISDVRGTSTYKRALLERLVLAGFATAFDLEGVLP